MDTKRYIPRIIGEEITNYLAQDKPPFHVLLLSGARQCGKSTLLEHLFPPTFHHHINFAKEGGLCEAIDQTRDFDDFTLLLESRLSYRMGQGKVIVFDEAQLSRKIGGYVRFMKEVWQNQHVFLTGSTLSTLFDQHQKPTGRVVEFVLRPFNFREFLVAMGKQVLAESLEAWSAEKPFSEVMHQEFLDWLQVYLKVGGLPEVVMAYQEGGDYLRLLANLFAYYKRDFKGKYASETLTAIFSQIFLRIAASGGSPITLSSIIKSSSPGYKKLPDALSLLEAWHQVIKVDCEVSQLSKIGSLTPKRYLFDLGIRYLQHPALFGNLSLQDEENLKRQDLGGVIENFVVAELVSLGSPHPVKSWAKTHQSGSVDFLWSGGRQAFAIEVKSSLKFSQKHLSGLYAYREFYPQSLLILANLDRGGLFKANQGEVMGLPVYAVEAFLRKN